MKMILSLVLLCLLTTNSEEANILVLLPLPLYSHTHTFLPVFKELARRGHNVTMVSPFPQKESIPNWTEVNINATATQQRIGKFKSEVIIYECSNKISLRF